jgi:hypothetical protein
MMVTPPFYAFAALWFFKAPASWFWSTRAGQSPARHSSDGAAVPLNAGAALP